MASSAEMLAGSLGLLVFTFCDLLLYLAANSIMAPFAQIFGMFKIDKLSISEVGFVWYLPWVFLLLFELGAIMSFIYVVGRRQISGSEYL